VRGEGLRVKGLIMGLIYIELHDNGAMKARVEQFGDILNEGIKTWFHYWFDIIAPKHFQLGAARKYDYAPRTEKYQQRKRAKGGLPALVWSGRARDRLLRHGFFKVETKEKGKYKGFVVGSFITGSEIRYFWYQPTKKKFQPNMARELTTISKEEKQQLTAFIQKRLIEELQNVAGTPMVYR
jgi:hypothetical protein